MAWRAVFFLRFLGGGSGTTRLLSSGMALATILLGLSLAPPVAYATPVTLMGQGRLSLALENTSLSHIVHGTLVDDVGLALPSARIEVQLLDRSGVAIAFFSGAPCGKSGTLPKSRCFLTDSLGQITVPFPLTLGTIAKVHASFSGSSTMEPVATDLLMNKEGSLQLQWVSLPDSVDLDRQEVELGVSLSPSWGALQHPLPVTLFDLGHPIATTTLLPEQRGRFSVPTARLAGPGVSKLEVRAASSDEPIAPLETLLLRTAHVHLAAQPPDHPVILSDGVRLLVHVTTTRGAVSQGTLEARLGDQILAVAPVAQGVAELFMQQEVHAPMTLRVTLWFLPSSAEWVAGEPLGISLKVRPPPWWRVLYWLTPGFAVLLWIAQGWRFERQPSSRRPFFKSLKPRPALSPAWTFSSHSEPGLLGWRGQVRDAHTLEPLPGARVRLEERGFGVSTMVQEVHCDESGGFLLQQERSPRYVIMVEALGYVPLEAPAPPYGELTLRLTLRRRAILDSFAQIARVLLRMQEKSQADPTPKQVLATAAQGGQDRVAAWATAVEQTAFGVDLVDASAHARVDELAAHLQYAHPRSGPQDPRPS